MSSFGKCLGNQRPVGLPSSRSTRRPSTFPFPPPPPLCGDGRAAPQSSLCFSDSGNGPAAAGEGEAGATSVTGNASGPNRPSPFTRAQLASLPRARQRPSDCVSALRSRSSAVFQLYPHASWEEVAAGLVPAPGRGEEGGRARGSRAGPGSIRRAERS